MEDTYDYRAVLKAAMDEHLEPMVQLAGEFAPSRDKAEDLVEKAFVSVCNDMNSSSNGNGTPVKDLLYSSLVNLIIDGNLRDSSRPESAPAGKLSHEFAGTPEPVENLKMLMSRVDGSDVYQVVSELPHEQRLLTLLYYLAGFTQRQVAELTDLTLPQVERRLGKSRQRLHEFIWQRGAAEAQGETVGS